jgi:Acetyl xylan esterase (AXE1)
MRGSPKLISIPVLIGALAFAQTEPSQVRPILEPPLQTPEVVAYQLRHYLLGKVPQLHVPATAQQWTAAARNLRQDLLKNLVFHGWPQRWIESPLKVEDLGLIPSGKGYHLRKLRYEVVPGFWVPALLYEPEMRTANMPAILNVNGHVGASGKAIEYKQKRCINQALRGVFSLNVEWLNCGELCSKENRHWMAAHLEVVGAHALGLFYLAMRKGLDYLYQHPNVDRNRIGMTGLSGGGWQTIFLSALDERVSVAIPVAGYASLVSAIERADSIGDIEQDATDLYAYADYTHLTALRAPRPTLLIYNAEDNCCFRAPLVKPYIFERVKPIFRLFGSEEAFAWHENTDPSTHNYQLDNRQQSYRFFGKHFRLPPSDWEIPVDAEVKSAEELTVGLPKDNLTILSLAKQLADQIVRRPMPSDERGRRDWVIERRAGLKRILRYSGTTMQHPWSVANTKNNRLESLSYRFEFNNGLSATGIWLKAIITESSAPVTIILHDEGKQAACVEVSARLNRGERVLAVDLLFTGDAAALKPGPSVRAENEYTQMVSGVGDRPLGLAVAQLIGVIRWLRQSAAVGKVRLESTGIRSQVTALVAGALEPELISEVVVRKGMKSLRHLLDAPVEYSAAPDLFCLDLYKEFDLEDLHRLAAPLKITAMDNKERE